MATSHSRGWPIYFDEKDQVWRYSDTGEEDDHSRPCRHCGEAPTAEGYDACLGYLEGVIAACCGHGAYKPILVKEGE